MPLCHKKTPEPFGISQSIRTRTLRNLTRYLHPNPPEPHRTLRPSAGIFTGTLRNLTRYLHRNPPEPHEVSAPEPSGTWCWSCTESHRSYIIWAKDPVAKFCCWGNTFSSKMFEAFNGRVQSVFFLSIQDDWIVFSRKWASGNWKFEAQAACSSLPFCPRRVKRRCPSQIWCSLKRLANSKRKLKKKLKAPDSLPGTTPVIKCESWRWAQNPPTASWRSTVACGCGGYLKWQVQQLEQSEGPSFQFERKSDRNTARTKRNLLLLSCRTIIRKHVTRNWPKLKTWFQCKRRQRENLERWGW